MSGSVAGTEAGGRTRRRLRRALVAAAAVTAVAVPAVAAGSYTVTALDGGSGWVHGRFGGGAVSVDAKQDPGFQDGSLRLEAVSQDDWAYAYKPSSLPLSQVTQLSYRTYRDSSSSAPEQLTASFQLQLDCDGRSDVGGAEGTPVGFFPFLNPQQGAVQPDRWQQWDAAAGVWYSPAHLGPNGAVSSAASPGSVGGEGDYRSLTDLRQACPSGLVVGFGVAHGANSAGLVSYADDVVFNGQAVNFATPRPSVPAPPAAPTFTDVPPTHPFHTDVTWLAESGVTLGVGGGRFDTTSPVQRQQMAAFLHRLSRETGYVPPTKPTFADVPASRSLYSGVEWLAQSGVTRGIGNGLFGAALPVQRQQMAAFLFRMSGDDTYAAPARARFSDVPTNHPFYREISWLADKEVTLGVGGGRFDTTSPVQRQHMAAFLHRYVSAVSR